MPRLEGKVAIITGAASGIGQATADLFRSEGATVVAADRMEGVDVVSVDAGSEADVERLVEQTVADHGGVDVFFANAGISGGLAGLFEQSSADWEEILRVNLIGPSLAIKYGAPPMKENGGGSIVCTASVAGLRANAGKSAYAASKAGVSQDTPLAHSWAGIRTLRLADGPDEVHNRAIAKLEFAKHAEA